MSAHLKQSRITNSPSSFRRRKLWDLEHRFHCSVIGTCLSLDELRRLGRKMGVPKEILADDYRLHITFVGIIGERSGEARLINKHLDRKYREAIRRFSNIRDPKAVETLWRDALSSGEVASAYWALVTHPCVSDELLFHAFGRVHMLSHLSGASIRVDMQQLVKLRRHLPELEHQLKAQQQDAQRALTEKKEIIQALNLRLVDMLENEREIERLRERVQVLEGGEVIDELRSRVEEYTAQLAVTRAVAERAEANAQECKALALSHGDRHMQLEIRIALAATERDALEQTLERLLAPDCGRCENSDDCPGDHDLCNRCILFVGGRNRQCAHFRALVERRNGQFIHHDGGLEESKQRLATLLARADAVLCPLDCVSHDAVNRIKRDCKRYGKPLQLLPQSSLAAFIRGLHEVAVG